MCTGLKSSLFNLGSGIVSINNCCRVVSQSHKDQAAGIYDLHLEAGVWHTQTHTHIVRLLPHSYDRKAQHAGPSVNAAAVQVFI